MSISREGWKLRPAITVDLFSTQPTSLVIPRPADDDERYAADEWVQAVM